MDYNQFNNLEEFERFIYNKEMPSDHISERVDRMMALIMPRFFEQSVLTVQYSFQSVGAVGRLGDTEKEFETTQQGANLDQKKSYDIIDKLVKPVKPVGDG